MHTSCVRQAVLIGNMVLLIVVTSCVSGCTRQYVIKFSNGSRIVAASKPRLKDGNYYFKDGSGRETSVPAGRVQEIAPASMMEQEKPLFNPSAK